MLAKEHIIQDSFIYKKVILIFYRNFFGNIFSRLTSNKNHSLLNKTHCIICIDIYYLFNPPEIQKDNEAYLNIFYFIFQSLILKLLFKFTFSYFGINNLRDVLK